MTAKSTKKDIPNQRIEKITLNSIQNEKFISIYRAEALPKNMTNLKAVIPVAGLGMHMLPATKAIPKEMLPVVDKPMIQYIIDECVATGIKEIILITHASKNAIENHFDTSYELEALLEARVKRQLLSEVQSICPPGVTIMNVRQSEPLGLGHSLLCARPMIDNQPFAVILPDVLLDDATADPLRYNLVAMVARFEQTGRSQVLVQHMLEADLSEYSVIVTEPNLEHEGDTALIKSFVEKPGDAQILGSKLAAVGRYVLSGDIWHELENLEPGAWGRIQLTDAIANLSKKQPVEAYQLMGKSYDCGRKMGYMQAFVAWGLRHNIQGHAFRHQIQKLLEK